MTRGLWGRPQAGATADGEDVAGADLSAPADDGSASRAPGPPVPAAGSGGRQARSGLVRGPDPHSDAPWLPVPGCDRRISFAMPSCVLSNSPWQRTSPSRPPSATATALRAFAALIPTNASPCLFMARPLRANIRPGPPGSPRSAPHTLGQAISAAQRTCGLTRGSSDRGSQGVIQDRPQRSGELDRPAAPPGRNACSLVDRYFAERSERLVRHPDGLAGNSERRPAVRASPRRTTATPPL